MDQRLGVAFEPAAQPTPLLVTAAPGLGPMKSPSDLDISQSTWMSFLGLKRGPVGLLGTALTSEKATALAGGTVPDSMGSGGA